MSKRMEPRPMAMSEYKARQAKGEAGEDKGVCPLCGGHDTTADSDDQLELEEGTLYRLATMTCWECGAEWTDVMTCTPGGFESLEVDMDYVSENRDEQLKFVEGHRADEDDLSLPGFADR